jgi:hypothetical protein
MRVSYPDDTIGLKSPARCTSFIDSASMALFPRLAARLLQVVDE